MRVAVRERIGLSVAQLNANHEAVGCSNLKWIENEIEEGMPRHRNRDVLISPSIASMSDCPPDALKVSVVDEN